MKKRKTKIPVKKIIIILILFSIVYLFFRSLSIFLWSSEYFNIETFMVNDKNIDLSYLKDRNIFLIDLKKEAERLSSKYPGYYKIKIIRRLPNCLKVDLQKREAIAYVRLYRYFAVDEEAVLFSMGSDTGLDPNLPIIGGLETKIFSPRSGIRYNGINELLFSLSLIAEAEKLKTLKNYRINKIEASSLDKFAFYILDNVEIKIGERNVNYKLRLLNSMLAHLGEDLARIQYIDLRFKEPVIKYRYEK